MRSTPILEGRGRGRLRGRRQQLPPASLAPYLHVCWIPLETLLGSDKCLVPFPKVVKGVGLIAQEHSQVPGGNPVRKNKLEIRKTIFLQIQKTILKDHHSDPDCCHAHGDSAGNVPGMAIRADPCRSLKILGHLQGTICPSSLPNPLLPAFNDKCSQHLGSISY